MFSNYPAAIAIIQFWQLGNEQQLQYFDNISIDCSRLLRCQVLALVVSLAVVRNTMGGRFVC